MIKKFVWSNNDNNGYEYFLAIALIVLIKVELYCNNWRKWESFTYIQIDTQALKLTRQAQPQYGLIPQQKVEHYDKIVGYDDQLMNEIDVKSLVLVALLVFKCLKILVGHKVLCWRVPLILAGMTFIHLLIEVEVKHYLVENYDRDCSVHVPQFARNEFKV